MKPRRAILLLVAAVAGGTLACDELLPTAGEEGLFPFLPESFEVILPYSEFVDSARVYGGFGTVTGLATAIAALEYDEGLTAHAVFRFEPILNRIFFLDSAGASRLDSLYTIVGGRFRLSVDTAGTEAEDQVEIAAGSMQTPWHPRTASWDYAVDTIHARIPWDEPGGGSVASLGTQLLSPEDTTSLVFEVDSLQANILARADDDARGLLVKSLTAGSRVEFATAVFEVDVRPSFRPELVVQEPLELDFLSLFYEEPPDDPAFLRVGGAPSRRTVLFLGLPDSVDGPAAVCGANPCRFAVTPATVNYAELLLSVEPGVGGFTPREEIPVDVREVVVPALLPEAPLGPSGTGRLGLLASPDAVAGTVDLGRNFPVILTDFVRVKVADSEEATSRPAVLAILSGLEPFLFEFLSIAAGGTENEPLLRLIITPRNEIRFR